MRSYRFKNSLFSLLLVSMFFTSCSGQTSSKKTTNNIDSTNKSVQHPKIVRTQGTKCENVVCQLLDKDGNIWFSIRGEGAYRYDGKSFTNFTTKDGLCSNDVSAIIQDRSGNILIGTKNGICMYDNIKFTKYPLPDTLSITCMLEDKDGNLWFGAMNKGIYRYDGKNLSNFLYKYKHPIFGEKYENYISDILQDKNGNIWFSSWNRGGVWRYDGTILTHLLPSADYYSFFEDERSNTNSSSAAKYVHSPDYITDDMIFSISEDRAGNIWFATRRHGACRYNGKTFTSFEAKEGFLSNNVSAILEDKKGNLWFTSGMDGVYFYDGKTFRNFTKNDGLANNAVMNMMEDKEGNLWFGTKWFGLSQYDGKTFTTFSQYEN